MKFAAAFVVVALTLTGAAQAAPDPALKSFIAAFSDAIRQGALDKATAMTHFPLRIEAYHMPTKLGRSEFKGHFGEYGNKYGHFADCLKKKTPEHPDKAYRDLGDWVIDCDGNDFYFKMFDGQWRHSGWGNVNE